MSVVLLVETNQGDTVAVKFPSIDQARDWEDEHEGVILARGCVQVVTKAQALELSR